ncbi:MAG TPA: M48 family metallopeptidase [Mogibacterium sp.]|nr:M48 family metallopeptidase [Mogibacterium sp.]
MFSNQFIGGLPVEVTKKKALKNLYIRILPPEGKVVVSSPSTCPDEEIKLFVLKKLPEIMVIRERMLAQVRQSQREYVSGESHYLWGKPYMLEVVKGGNKYRIKKVPNKIIFTVPEGATRESKERAFNEWYREDLKRVLANITKPIEQRMGISANEYRVKNMKTKWGTCNIEKRRIWINLQLAKKPIECLEYIITHELVHLIEKNHTHRFHALVETYYPTWKDAQKKLEQMPLDYLESNDLFFEEK